MRKLTAYLIMSLDGVVEAPETFVRADQYADIHVVMSETIAEQDAILLGRNMYVEWSAFWPTATHEPFASFINNHPKYVVSSTLADVSWQNSVLLKGDLERNIAGLKAPRCGRRSRSQSSWQRQTVQWRGQSVPRADSKSVS